MKGHTGDRTRDTLLEEGQQPASGGIINSNTFLGRMGLWILSIL